jgi:hypothetical protein
MTKVMDQSVNKNIAFENKKTLLSVVKQGLNTNTTIIVFTLLNEMDHLTTCSLSEHFKCFFGLAQKPTCSGTVCHPPLFSAY